MSIHTEFNRFIEDNFTESEIKLIVTCYNLADRCHENQVDKNCNDYIEHCLQVALNTQSNDYYIICTALLHDVIEDYYMVKFPVDYEVVSKEVFEVLGIPSKIYTSVYFLTKVKGEDYASYIQDIKTPEIATKVKLADLKHNMDITRLPKLEEKDIERLKKYFAAYQQLKG